MLRQPLCKLHSFRVVTPALKIRKAKAGYLIPEDGTLNTEFGVSVDNAETTVADNSAAKAKRLSRAGASKASATVILNDFIVTVEDNKGNEVQAWTYSTLPELPTFPVGDYKVVVRSHNVEPAAWDAPYYEGEQAFSIQANKITEVGQVVCHLSNIRVSVKLSEKLLAALDDKTAPVVKITSTGANSLEFVPGEKKSAYFAATAELKPSTMWRRVSTASSPSTLPPTTICPPKNSALSPTAAKVSPSTTA